MGIGADLGIVLAGGAGRRLGGVLKAAVPVAGRPMLDRVLAALDGAGRVIVVGPDTLAIPAGVIRTREEPPGGGPVAGIGAALSAAPIGTGIAVIVGGDLPLLTAEAIDRLTGSIIGDVDGAVYVDGEGRSQWLCGAWRTESLVKRCHEVVAERGELANGSLRAFFGALRYAQVVAGDAAAPPYFDCDTEDDIRRAEEWLATMTALDDWIDAARTALGLDTTGDDAAIDQTLVLDVTRDVAHGVLRPAAPLTAYLLGLAVGRGADPAAAAAAITELARSWPAPAE
jgi:molybdopterin-guanine dinucleotide biosynthesis protein A